MSSNRSNAIPEAEYVHVSDLDLPRVKSILEKIQYPYHFKVRDCLDHKRSPTTLEEAESLIVSGTDPSSGQPLILGSLVGIIEVDVMDDTHRIIHDEHPTPHKTLRFQFGVKLQPTGWLDSWDWKEAVVGFNAQSWICSFLGTRNSEGRFIVARHRFPVFAATTEEDIQRTFLLAHGDASERLSRIASRLAPNPSWWSLGFKFPPY